MTGAINKFSRELKKRLKLDRASEIPAFLGNLSGVVSTGTIGKVYVTLVNGEVLEVYNNKVQNISRLPVLIGYGGGEKLQVIRSRDVFVHAPIPDLPPHGWLHTFPNPDATPIRGEQILPLLVEPYAGLVVYIHGGYYELADGWHAIPTQTLDLTSYVPASGALFARLEVDNTGAISVSSGTAVSSRAVLEYSDIPAADADKSSLAAVKLYDGQDEILFQAEDTDIIDLRFGRQTITPAALTDLTDGGTTTLHNHDGRYPREYAGKTAAPTVNDDSGDGYAIGDLWIDETNDKVYQALNVSVGAAVWVEITGGGGTPGGSDSEIQFNNSGAFDGDSEFTWNSLLKVLGIGDPSMLPAGISPDHTFWMTGDGVSPSQFMVAYGSSFAPFTTFMKADGDATTPTNVKDDQVIGRIRGRGYDGSGWTDTRLEIRFVADGDWSSGDTPTRIEFWVTPDGSSTLTLAMTIRSDGHVDIATGKEYRVNGAQHDHSASDVTSGTMATARLGSGTASSTTYLRGDQTWATVSSDAFAIIGDKRLSLVSNTPFQTGDTTAATTIYWTDGNTNLSVAAPSTTVTPFDVYYSISGNSLSTVNWTNDTTRATALARDTSGRLVKSGDTDKLYLGTGRTTGTSGQCEDSVTKRFLWNYYNQRLKVTYLITYNSYHTYTTTAWRELNGGTSVTRFEFVIGQATTFLMAGIAGAFSGVGVTTGYVGGSLDTTTAPTHQFNMERGQGSIVSYTSFSMPTNVIAVGYHYTTFVQYGSAANFYFATSIFNNGVWV